jgi:hypothetical protein
MAQSTIFMAYIKKQAFSSLQGIFYEFEVTFMMIGCAMKKKAAAAVLALMVSGSVFAAQPDTAYTEAMQNMIANPQGEYNVDFNMDLQMTKITVANVIDVRNTPFQFKMVTSVNALGKESKNMSTIYAEQDGKNLVIYNSTQKDGKTTWKKTISALKSEAPLATTFSKDHNVLSGVKSIENIDTNRFKISYDTSGIYKPSMKEDWAKEGLSEEHVESMVRLFQAIQNSGDVTLTATVDPAAKRVTHIDSTLTSQVNAIFNTFVDSAKGADNTKKFIKTMLDKSESTLTIDYKDLPANADLTAPKDVKDQAVLDKKSK